MNHLPSAKKVMLSVIPQSHLSRPVMLVKQKTNSFDWRAVQAMGGDRSD